MKREQFLGRVRSSLRTAQLPDLAEPGQAAKIEFADPVATFVAEATAVNAEVTRVSNDAVLAAVGEIAASVAASTFISWDDLDDVASGWSGWADDVGLERVDATVRTGPDDRKDDHARIGSVRLGVTTADYGIAASGSVVLCHGPGRPRSASLLVETHVVLLPADRILHSLVEAMDRVSWADTSNIAVITGPSRTGDIESVLTLGVHGPRHLHILVIE